MDMAEKQIHVLKVHTKEFYNKYKWQKNGNSEKL